MYVVSGQLKIKTFIILKKKLFDDKKCIKIKANLTISQIFHRLFWYKVGYGPVWPKALFGKNSLWMIS
jgi:hypothetical protein